MSYDTRLAARVYGGPSEWDDEATGPGSVRAAREKMQAGQLRPPVMGLPSRPDQMVNRRPPPIPSSPSDSSSLESPISPDQWPLANRSAPALPPRSPKRLLRPPRQAARPLSEDLPIQQPSPGSPEYLEPPSFRFHGADSDQFSNSNRPFSGASEASSLGSIPDFPVPEPPMPIVQAQLRRTPSLGPPPSSRRGPSSYYTQMSYVSPIVEEAESLSNTARSNSDMRSRHGSYASSNVFPSNSDGFYDEDDYPLSDDETITSGRAMSAISSHDEDSNLVRHESPVLLRQASMGRRTKPSIMTIKSTDSPGVGRSGSGRSTVAGAMGAGMGLGALGAAGSRLASRDGSGSPGMSSPDLLSPIIGSNNPFSSSESIQRFRNGQQESPSYTGSESPPYTGSESPSFPMQASPRGSTFAERVGFRRPPRLDVNAVRDAEARGSLTSLPDLIRRATRLAANLDRGKTASRIGMDFWDPSVLEKNQVRQSNAASLTDMLAAFPPPGNETPQRSQTPVGYANNPDWPIATAAIARSPLSQEVRVNNEKPEKRRRRCCGMPLWTFIVLLLVLLFIIAAAVVIPVVLVVIPNMNENSTSAAMDNNNSNNNNNNNNQGGSVNPAQPGPTSGSGDGNMNSQGACQNGGVEINNASGSTTCVCINGFTGSTCANNDATGCTTTSVPGANNATMGSGIPRLIDSAGNTFNVPIDTTRILSLFSSLSLSCAAENALITFNGLASRSIPSATPIDLKNTIQVTRSLPDLNHPHEKRDTEFLSSNITAVDFARVGVLFALQETGKLDTAASAQETIQDFLTSNRNGASKGNTVDLDVFELNLVDLTIKFRNGTTIRAS